MEKVCFVILHYMDLNTTLDCVDSILNNIKYENYSIIIVDNGSTNDSGYIIEKKFRKNNNVVVVFSKENLGFARGNNIGYQYAKEKLNAKYIIITNNDTIFEQSNFIEMVKKIYKKTHCGLLGPDIVTPTEIHQNPRREHLMSKREVIKALFIKTLFLYYFKIKKKLRLENRINILESLYKNKDERKYQKKDFMHPKERVVLVGACLIYTPEFIANEKYAFSPKTFMYGEEDLLAAYCIRKNYKVYYSPMIQVFHISGETTKNTHKNNLDKNIFMYKYMIEGYKLLLNEHKK